jgi:hypothetical protein
MTARSSLTARSTNSRLVTPQIRSLRWQCAQSAGFFVQTPAFARGGDGKASRSASASGQRLSRRCCIFRAAPKQTAAHLFECISRLLPGTASDGRRGQQARAAARARASRVAEVSTPARLSACSEKGPEAPQRCARARTQVKSLRRSPSRVQRASSPEQGAAQTCARRSAQAAAAACGAFRAGAVSGDAPWRFPRTQRGGLAVSSEADKTELGLT